MEWISPKQAAEQWGITERQAQSLCAQGKIPDAARIGRSWLIPRNAEKPLDGRTKAAKQRKG
ncbi:MAG: helix-turn-helix domain-containing protein [Clostridiales bacterium]|nr:helix-turn-helix domain-containing protein [Clostridiales bacterium]